MSVGGDVASFGDDGVQRRFPEWLSALASHKFELILVGFVIAGVILTANALYYEGYLPQPYYYGSQSFITDWTVSVYFSVNPGAYTDFASVYPPLSFVFLKIFSVHSCYLPFDDIFASRECDWMAPITIFGFYFATIPLVYLAYRAADRATAPLRTIAIVLGLPLLYAVERGNLIVPCFTFFVLGQSKILKAAWARWLCNAMAINFKPYLILTLGSHLVNRRWRWFEGSAVAGLLVYLVTYALEGAGSPIEVLTNISLFATSDSRGIFERAMYASSYVPILDLFKTTFPVMHFLGSRPIEWAEILLPAAMSLAKFSVLGVFALVCFRPRQVPIPRLSALAISLVLVLQDPGGYATLYMIFLVLMEKWKGWLSGTALVLCYVLSVSWDVLLMPVTKQVINSYLTNRVVGYEMGVNLGEVLRPGLVIFLVYTLAAMSIADLFRDGWFLNRRRTLSTVGANPERGSMAPAAT